MNRNNIEVIEITPVVHDGFCVGRLAGGKAVMVRGASSRGRVRAWVTSERSKVVYAQVVKVLTAPPDRVEHIWSEGAAAGLGEVELDHVAYPAQLRWKREVLAKALRRNGSEVLVTEVSRVAPDWLVALLGANPGRSRVNFAFDSAGFPVMNEAGTHRQHRTPNSPLLAADLEGLRLSDRKLAFTLDLQVKTVVPSVSASVFAVGNEVLDAGLVPTAPRVCEVVRVGARGHMYRIFTNSFWQTDYRASAVLVRGLLTGVGDISDFEVLELHAGPGLFSVLLAEAVGAAGRSTTVEGDALAVRLAGCNLRHAGFVGVPVERVAVSTRFLRGVDLNRRVSRGSLVMADSPRFGLGRDIAGMICGLESDLVALVSCDPVSYTRDLETLRRDGYRLQSFWVFGLFPYTQYAEVSSVLGR